MVMRLWTWQKQGFDLTGQNVQVRSLENSHFLNDIHIPKAQRDHFTQVYTKLFGILGGCQFHWYFTEEDEAKGKESYSEFSKQNRVLWEVDAPDGKSFKKICSIAWNRLLERHLERHVVPIKLCNYWKVKAISEAASEAEHRMEKWEQEFHGFWENKSEDELWDALFLEKCVDGCTDILLRHPLDDSWVVRNPIKEGIWWKMYKGNACGPKLFNSPLPCDGCSGRGVSP